MTGIFSFGKLNTSSEPSTTAITNAANATDPVATRGEVQTTALNRQPVGGPLAITLLEDDLRAESPTDAIMPLRRAAPTLETSKYVDHP
jgi:hypothetical protein